MLEILNSESVKEIILKRLEELKKALPEEGKKIILKLAQLLVEKGKISKAEIKELLADVSDDVLDKVNKVLDEIIDDLAVLAKVELRKLIQKI